MPTSRDELWRLFDELLNDEDPFVWWPGMRSQRGDDGDIGVVAGSPVGYRLRFRLHDLEETPMDRVTLCSDGDLDGRATMVFAPIDDQNCTLDVEWNVQVTPRWMRVTGFALRPVFVTAHNLAMRRGERGLAVWLRNRTAQDSDPVR